MPKRKYADPDIRGECRLCRGPVYRDEPLVSVCPDCQLVCRWIQEALYAPVPERLPRALRPVRVLGGDV